MKALFNKQNVKPFIFVMIAGVISFYLLSELGQYSNVTNAYLFSIKILLIALISLSVFFIIKNEKSANNLLQKTYELNKLNDRLQSRVAAIEMSVDGVFIANKEGCVKYLNQCFINSYDLKQKDRDQNIIDYPWLDMFTAPQKDIFKERAIPALEKTGSWRGEVEVIDQTSSKKRIMELSLAKLPDGGLVGNSQDISKNKESEKHKKDMEAQFYQAQKMEAVGRLSGGIAHDFNNILAAINGYAEFLIEDLADHPAEQKYAYKILEAGTNAKNLVNQILSFSRRSEGHLEHVDVLKVLKESLAMIRATAMTTIDVREDLSFSPAIISGNASQISQAVMNLCVNALDAMEDMHGILTVQMYSASESRKKQITEQYAELPDPSASPVVTITEQDDLTTNLLLGGIVPDLDYICIEVSDTGVGMSKIVMEHVFEPFFTTKPVDKGTGLGLAMVHGVVAQHQGAMRIVSTIGQGTRFVIFLPVQNKLISEKNEELKEIGKFEFEDARILLVEDQKNVRDMARKMLERLGFTVLTAENGVNALEVLEKLDDNNQVDLILTDHSMPKMTGLELVKECRSLYPDMPFVLLSGYSNEKLDQIQEDYAAIKDVLRKPIMQDALKEKLYNILLQERKIEENHLKNSNAA